MEGRGGRITGSLRRLNNREFQVILSYRVRICLKKEGEKVKITILMLKSRNQKKKKIKPVSQITTYVEDVG